MMFSRLKLRLSVATVLTGMMFLVITLIVASITILDIRRTSAIFREDLETQSFLMLETLNETLVDPLYFLDIDLLRALTKTIASQPQIDYVYVFTPDGRLLVDSTVDKYASGFIGGGIGLEAINSENVQRRFQGNSLEIASSVAIGREVIGGVQIGFDGESLDEQIRQIIFQHVVQGLIITTLGVILAYLLAQYFAQPLRQLVRATKNIAEGEYDFSSTGKRNDEFGDLTSAFNLMSLRLGERTAELQSSNEDLKKANEGLEFRVEERTADLTQTNQQLLQEVAERQRAEGALRKAEGHLGTVINNLPVIVFALDQQGTFTLSTGKGLEALGEDFKDMVGRSIYEVFDDVPGIVDGVQRALAGKANNLVVELGGVSLDAMYEPILDQDGLTVGVVGVALDISPLKQLEAQFLQSQKMESIGRLAGGIAHDFNNLLTAIIGYAQLGIMKLNPEDQLRGNLQEIQKSGERAAHLTSQLLAFSRKQVIAPKVINLNVLIAETSNLLERVIDETVELDFTPSPTPALVKIDPAQFEQVLVNLAVNARDAMPLGGKLGIIISAVEIGGTISDQELAIESGEFVLMTISDDGVGIPEDLRASIFEPFFTTKEQGKGTGLGLATCYGIVMQNGGHIEVESEVGTGTTFKIYLPKENSTVESNIVGEKAQILPRGDETVLLVEDEDSVRMLTSRVLTEQGYKVLEAINGQQALQVLDRVGKDAFDLLLTDIVMPKMGGKELANRLKEIRPDIKILFTSGYNNEIVDLQGVLDPNVDFIPKPSSLLTMTGKVREILDRESNTEAVLG